MASSASSQSGTVIVEGMPGAGPKVSVDPAARRDPHDEGSSDGAAPSERIGMSLRFEHWGYRHASRRHFAVRGLDLSIAAGERVLLLGASGIGKSTILEGAAGLLGDGETDSAGSAPDDRADDAAGVVEVDRADKVRSADDGTAHPDHDGTEVAPAVVDAEGGVTEGCVLVRGIPVQNARGSVGLVLQDPDAQAIFQRLGDNVAFGPENMNVPRARIWPQVRRSLEDVGLGGLQLHRSTMHLSGGQMQRLALAGALAMRPGVLLLDEPTANLDPAGVKQIVGAVSDVVRGSGATMVLVEHRADPWIDLIDRVVVLGREVADGDAVEDRAAGDAVKNGTAGDAHDDDGVSGNAFGRTVVVADGTPNEVFSDPSLDFAALGIWVPRRYRRAGDEISRIHTAQEPVYDPAEGVGEPILSTRDLAIGRDGTPIAEHVDLAFRSGQITALIGPNGAGKSTLSLTLAGLLHPVSGEVRAGDDLAEGLDDRSPIDWRSTDLASRISYVFQNPEHQFARGSVLDEAMLGPLRTGMNPQEARTRALALLERFGLRRYAAVNPYTLSGGEKRRLTVVSALAAAPRVLILDEPTFGQDRRTWMQMVRLIHDLRADKTCIIVVTHDRDLVTALGARVVEFGPASAGPASGAERVAVSAINARAEQEADASRSPYLASLNPSYRLMGGFLASLPLLVSLDWVSASTALALEVVVLMAIGFSPLRIVRSTWPIFVGAPGSALAVLLYGKSGGAVWWQWGMINITDRSSQLAVATGIRILAIGIPAIIAVLGIDATDLADSFSQVLRLPDRFVYGGLAGIRLFSVLSDDWTALTASRRSRGLGDDNAVKAFLPQAFALLVLSIRRSTMLATAMQARGFGGLGPRSHARLSAVHTRDYVFLIGCVSMPAVALIVSIVTGAFAPFGG